MKLATLFKSTLFYTIIGFLPVASQAILAPLFSHYLSQYEYGLVNLLNIFGGYITIFIGLGFESAFSVFYFYYTKRRQWLNRLVSTVFLSVLVFAILSALAVWVFRAPISHYFSSDTQFPFLAYVLPVYCICLTTVCFTLIQYYFRNEENLKLYGIFSIGFFILISAGQYLGVRYISSDAWGITVGRMIASLILCVAILVYIFKTTGIHFSFAFVKKCFRYAYPMAIYGFLWVAFENIDKITVDKNFGTEVLGVYGIAVLFASLLELIRVSFVYSINPNIYKNIEGKDIVSYSSVQTSIRFFAIALCNALALLMTACYPVMHLFINKKFHGAIYFIPVMFLAMIPRLYFSYFAMPLFYYGKTKALALINLVSLGASWLYLLIIKDSLGPIGVCFVVVLAKGVQCMGVWVYTFYFSKVKVKYNFNMLGKDNIIVAVTGVSLVLTILLGQQSNTYSYLFDLIPLATVFTSVILYGRRAFNKIPELWKSIKGRQLKNQ